MRGRIGWFGRVRRGVRFGVAGALLVTAMLAAIGAAAQDVDLLLREFDARDLSAAEKRLLQVGLTASGAYSGLIDGRWGQASQAAFERYLQANDLAEADGLIRNYHVADLGLVAHEFAARNGLVYRGGTPYGHRLLTPRGDFDADFETGIDDSVLNALGLEIRTFRSDAAFAAGLHDAFERDLPPAGRPYLVRNAGRWVTATTTGADRFYLRTDLAPDADSAYTTIVSEGDADPALYAVIVGAITLDGDATLDAPGGTLAQAIDAGLALLAAAEPASPRIAPGPEPVAASGPDAPPVDGAGTAFFVNNHDLVTAAHVIDACRAVVLTDGTPLAIVARHPTLDLALLSSPVRSRDWIAVAGAGAARLGQSIFVLGYPFFGTYGTSLNVTGGHVSALAGIDDSADALTISAPVQPGNSGGPLVAQDGTVIGVVVARLDGLKVVQATGALPENVNYAVAGAPLLDFLAREAVSLPAANGAAGAPEDGIPEAMQRAVVPVLCLRS